MAEYIDREALMEALRKTWDKINDSGDYALGFEHASDIVNDAPTVNAELTVMLPCKVGDTVYTLFCDKVVEKHIGRIIINGYTKPRIWVDIDCEWSTTQTVRWDLSVGKTVFLTREEAQAAIGGTGGGK